MFPLALLILLPFSLLGARTRLLPSRLPALMMAFFPLLTSSPVFLPFLPSGARALFPCAGSASTGFFYARCSLVTLDPWGASPFLFFPTLSPVFYICPHPSPVLASLPIPSPPPLPSLPTLLASLHSLLLHLRQVAQCSCLVLS